MGKLFDFQINKINEGASIGEIDLLTEFEVTTPRLLLIWNLGSFDSSVILEKVLRFITGYSQKEVLLRNVNRGTRSKRSAGRRPRDTNDPLIREFFKLRKFYASTAIGIIGPKHYDSIKRGSYVLAHFLKSMKKAYFESLCQMAFSKYSFPVGETLRSLSKSVSDRVKISDLGVLAGKESF